MFCGLFQFLQNMVDFAPHCLARCLINHMCGFSYCNNSLEEGGGDRAAEQESGIKGVSRHVVLRMVDSHTAYITMNYLFVFAVYFRTKTSTYIQSLCNPVHRYTQVHFSSVLV